jgi:hypothetical protein
LFRPSASTLLTTRIELAKYAETIKLKSIEQVGSSPCGHRLAKHGFSSSKRFSHACQCMHPNCRRRTGQRRAERGTGMTKCPKDWAMQAKMDRNDALRIEPKVLLPEAGGEESGKDTLRQK